MANYVVGLDFGTYQTKVCINHLDSNPQQYEFFKFKADEDEGFFFLSKVFYLKDHTFRYGYYNGEDVLNEFNYFKIASAEDERFKLVSKIKKPVYNYGGSFGEFSPEFLSVIFITNILLTVKQHFNSSANSVSSPRKGLFSRLRRIKEVSNTFSVRLGIPTEYSKKVNLLRRKKFETILLISEILQKKNEYSLTTFQSLTKTELFENISSILNELNLPDTDLEKLMNEDYRISVYPESAAGLLYFAKSGKLDTGIYAAIDIGGGTSDISFFNVQHDKKIMYLASESFLTACNNIYIDYIGRSDVTLQQISAAEKKIIELISKKEWDDDKKYRNSIKKVKLLIEGRLKYLFNNSVFSQLGYINPSNIRYACHGKPCLVYGGGISHPWISNWGGLMIYDGGIAASLCNDNYTYMDTRNVNAYIPDQSQIKSKNWEKYFSLMIVAFGLSYLHHKDHNYWEDHDYKSIQLKDILEEVPHPRNEGMYIYNVLERRWNT
ncbi:MAG: hypothetical protein K0B11_01965 [Mariniphaga sp.]|nr:hypothetical protein [Mariniphaga sp.]